VRFPVTFGTAGYETVLPERISSIYTFRYDEPSPLFTVTVVATPVEFSVQFSPVVALNL